MSTMTLRMRTLQAAALIAVAMLSASLLAGGMLKAAENRVIDSVTLDSVTFHDETGSVTVEPGATIAVSLTVSFGGGNYGSTGWVISRDGDGDFACVGHESGASPATVEFDITAPTEPGTYTATFIAYNGNACSSFASDPWPVEVIVTSPAGVTVVESEDSTDVEEGGATDTYTVVLEAEPSGEVTITISTDGQSTVDPASLTFGTGNWRDAQLVTVTAVDDDVAEGNHTSAITHTASGGGYDGVSVVGVTANITDDDAAGIAVAPKSGLVTTEGGGTATFTVVLTSQPASSVTIGLSSSDTSEGTVSASSLVFTSSNWNVAQTVMVTGVDDVAVDGDIAYIVLTAAAVSADENYSDLDADDVSVTNTDDDAAGIAVAPKSGLVTTEGGGTATFTVVLSSQPTADVTIALSSSDTSEGTISTSTLTFTPANWSTAQTVTVTGVDDSDDDGNVPYFVILGAAVSADSDYGAPNAIDPANVAVTNIDDDPAGVTVTPTSGLVTTEGGGTATFTVVLTSQPTATVTIGLSSSDTSEGTVSPSSLVFTSSNWNVARPVTVTGVDDSDDDGNVVYVVILAAAVSGDASYDGLDPANVVVINIDDADTPTVTGDDFTLSDADACKNGGWEKMGFRTQGLCISHGEVFGLLAAGSGGGPPWPLQSQWNARDRGRSGDD